MNKLRKGSLSNTNMIYFTGVYMSETKINKKKEILGWVFTILAAVAVFAVFMIFFQPGIVSGSSMEPNYFGGDRFFITRDWCCGDYEYEDVVCVDINGRVLIKRVIGLPGDTIEIKDGKVYRNNELVDESEYLSADVKTNTSIENFKIVVGEDEWFVLGDNRAVSVDSRSIGCVDNIIGKTWFIYRQSWFK